MFSGVALYCGFLISIIFHCVSSSKCIWVTSGATQTEITIKKCLHCVYLISSKHLHGRHDTIRIGSGLVLQDLLILVDFHKGVLKYVTCTPPLHAGSKMEEPVGEQGSVGDWLGVDASTFLVGDSGFSGACVTQLSATAATAMLRGGVGNRKQLLWQQTEKER